MDELTAEQVDAVLEMLRDHGVEEFEGLGFRVRFKPGTVADAQEPEVRQERAVPRTAWEDPSLWQGGEVPTFVTRKKGP